MAETTDTVKKKDSNNREPIKVRSLAFRPGGVTFPNGNVHQSIDSRPKEHRDGWEIEWRPWMRMFHVRTVPASKNAKSTEFLIPETWAIAELETDD